MTEQEYELCPNFCEQCQKIIPFLKRKNRFCDRSCSISYTNHIKRTIVLCINCSNEIIGTKYKSRKYCCKECNLIYKQNKKQDIKNYKEQVCLFCNKNILNHRIRTYCDGLCQKMYEWEMKKIEILNNGKVGIRPLKKYLLEIRGNNCEICGINEWCNKPLLLILDHIDGNSENNNLGNLRLVCSNCDSQLPTYKKKNSGNGRAYRRQRYANNQSY